jgi:hypothetical protein
MSTSLFKNLSWQQLASIAWSCTVLAQLERPWFAHFWTTLANHTDGWWMWMIGKWRVLNICHNCIKQILSLQLEYPNLDLFIGTEWEWVLSEAWEKEQVSSKCGSSWRSWLIARRKRMGMGMWVHRCWILSRSCVGGV